MTGRTPEPRLDPGRDLREPVALAKYPLVALAPSATPFQFHGREHQRPFYIDVRPDDPALGLATLADADFLIWATSAIMRQVNARQAVRPTLSFRPADVLHALGRPGGGRQHRLLAAAMDRLHNTAVVTDLAPHGARRVQPFNLLEGIERPSPGTRGLWSITLAAWLTEQAVAGHVLKVGCSDLQLRGLARRAHGWARSHAGGKDHETWQAPVAHLHVKAASQDSLRRFRAALREIVDRNALPGFALRLDGAGKAEALTVTRLTSEAVAEPEHGAVLDLPDEPPPDALIGWDGSWPG